MIRSLREAFNFITDIIAGAEIDDNSDESNPDSNQVTTIADEESLHTEKSESDSDTEMNIG